MELRLLGPFDVLVDATPHQVAGRGERALLALLALSPGKVVATSTLIDALWGEDNLPEDPGNALQLRVSKLRRALGGLGAPDLVRREGAGYLLDAEPDDVDVHRFARLIDTARRTGEAQTAIDAYDEALGMWRGEPLVDFAGERWTTVEDRPADRAASRGGRRTGRTDAHHRPVRAGRRGPRTRGRDGADPGAVGRSADDSAVQRRSAGRGARRVRPDPSGVGRRARHRPIAGAPSGDGGDPAPGPVRNSRPGPASPPAATDQGRFGAGPGNLPLRSTSFVGRAEELARTVELLGSARLVTLAGPGGAGKTALGIEAARAAHPKFRDGAVFVRLAAVSERDMLAHAVADALGVTIEGGTAAHRPRDVLVGHLRNSNTLLVLDNCEHLIEAVASLTETILSRCPEVQVVATSREALAVPGEVQLTVAPLPVPDPGTRLDAVAAFAAARLFLDRAQAATPELVVDAETLNAVGAICQRLDGIPLALELAAARLARLSPTELAERVVDRFAVLTSGSRTADARQQTLRATVDWSHDLLTADERLLFRRLAVFRGGWTLDAAEHVATGPDLVPAAVLDLLDRLVRQSLVVTDRTGGRTRYRMLETLRQYAADKLDAAGERDALSPRTPRTS